MWLPLALRVAPYAAAALAALAFILWQRHDAAEAVRREVAAEAAATITKAEEARRGADTDAARTPDPARGLREHGWLRD